jgi:hypothetical protein
MYHTIDAYTNSVATLIMHKKNNAHGSIRITGVMVFLNFSLGTRMKNDRIINNPKFRIKKIVAPG